MAPLTTRAILLRSHDYGDTSRILRFYTEGAGLVSVVARGVRGRSGKGATTLAAFATGELTAFVKPQRDLHTMKDFSCERLRAGIGGDVLVFAGASAVAELVLAHAEQERYAGLFAALEASLDALDHARRDERAGVVLAALWVVIGAFGFAPQLDACVRCGEAPEPDEVGRFDHAAGGIRCAPCAEGAAGPRLGPRARAQVERFLAGEAPGDLDYPRRHLALVSDFVSYHLVSKPLKSLSFLGSLFPADEPEVSVG